MSYDLTFVAPHRRDEVLRRIRVLERFIARPGRAMAEGCAADLGIGVVQFYNLVRAWRAYRQPERLAGAGRPRMRKSFASTEQQRLVAQASAELPDATLHAIASRAIALGRSAGIAMPSPNSIRKMVELSAIRRLAPASPANGADVVVASCAVDIPVANGGSPTMPVATLVISTASPPAVLGLALAMGDHDPATLANCLAEAAPTILGITGPERRPVIALDHRVGPGWDDITAVLSTGGIDVMPMAVRAHSVMNDAVSLLGRKPAGFALKPDLTEAPPERRRPTIPAKAAPMTLAQAETLMRERLMDHPAEPVPSGGADRALGELVAGLRSIASRL